MTHASKVVTIPLAARTARATDLAIGERCEGPVCVAPDGRRLDRHGAAGSRTALLLASQPMSVTARAAPHRGVLGDGGDVLPSVQMLWGRGGWRLLPGGGCGLCVPWPQRER